MDNLTVEQQRERERLAAYCVMMSPPTITRSCVACLNVIGDGDVAYGVTVTMPINIDVTVWYCTNCHTNMDAMASTTMGECNVK